MITAEPEWNIVWVASGTTGLPAEWAQIQVDKLGPNHVCDVLIDCRATRHGALPVWDDLVLCLSIGGFSTFSYRLAPLFYFLWTLGIRWSHRSGGSASCLLDLCWVIPADYATRDGSLQQDPPVRLWAWDLGETRLS